MGKPPQRPTYNNNNPYNKLSLNKYHQIGARQHASQSKLLHKKKRDLERMIKYRKQKNQTVSEEKLGELQQIEGKLSEGRKQYEKKMRKEFFIRGKYRQIMEIELRKVNKKIRAVREQLMQSEDKEGLTAQLQEWQQKQRYIKFFPKQLKYVSLFPSNKPLQQQAIQFQKKVMDDIQKNYKIKVSKRNEFGEERDKKGVKRHERVERIDRQKMEDGDGEGVGLADRKEKNQGRLKGRGKGVQGKNKKIDNFFIQDQEEEEEEDQ